VPPRREKRLNICAAALVSLTLQAFTRKVVLQVNLKIGAVLVWAGERANMEGWVD
jgi:hypothetical protein